MDHRRGARRRPDPGRLSVALVHARGSHAGHRYFGGLWEATVRRVPHHNAPKRPCATRHAFRHGSHLEWLGFADRHRWTRERC
ncbi:hypothetical protein [Actinacidiphila glaucinigra]|uniref:hypothetical protein n=1 Tax=Actinacidiphila glaucinigra TaxID=235986 RepID=UPI0037123F08